MKCKICGCVKETRREMHGHLIRMHREDYERAGFELDRCTEGAPARKDESKAKQKQRKLYSKPEGFRFLNKQDSEEANAIKSGFAYIDAEQNIYTASEAKTEGWI